MEEIRTLTAADMDESIRLSQFAFQYEISASDKEERLKRMKPEESTGIFVDGHLAAKLTVLPLSITLNGMLLPMGGVSGVATWPEYRRSGYVAKLLSKALADMRSAGQTVSLLAPFQFSFYRKFGWETLTEYKRYEISVDKLPKFAETNGCIRRVDHYAELDEVYKRYALRFNGMLARSEQWWEWNVLTLRKKGQNAVYYDEQGVAQGYMLYQVKEKKMNVFEFVFLDETARRALWRFIANHDSMINEVELQADAKDALPFLLDNPRIKQEVVPYFMARIVDAQRFLTQFRYTAGPVGGLIIKLTDVHAPWNEGYYRIYAYGTEGVQAERVEEADAQAAAELLACDIQTLSAMFMGYQRPRFMSVIGRLSGSEKAVDMLEDLIPPQSTYLLDFF